ncbi:MAG: 16S rRNA (guanine(527)-N(7))-methyltransferase RsmG [Thermoflexales bacterium]|nr:16S rRNA (guanine(527)-N(7))-methyltransferase RsmG [Thermoflexales bacterium]
MIDIQLLASGAHDLGVDLKPDQLERFSRFADQLIEWNARFNLTTIIEPRDIVIKHFLDSLSVMRAIPAKAKRIIDVGAGAGLPGFPIKIARPDVSLVLVEATRKKCDFLEAMIKELKVYNVFVVNARAEDVGQDPDHREYYDVAVARAVADLPVLAEYLLPLVKVGGVAVAQKSKKVEEEVERADTAILLLGGLDADVIPVTVPGLPDERNLVVIEKIVETPEEYPRRVGIPSKTPIE